jgi:hypothetical protein
MLMLPGYNQGIKRGYSPEKGGFNMAVFRMGGSEGKIRLLKEEIIRKSDRSFLESLSEDERAEFLKMDFESQKKIIMQILAGRKQDRN